MVEILKHIAHMINNMHDDLVGLFYLLGFDWSDKQMHFAIIAVVGIIIFAISQFVFKFLAKYSITAISFIYTFTVTLVLVFVIEIEQKITGSGKMEAADILYGLYGFLFAFAIYLAIKWSIIGIKHLIKHIKHKREINCVSSENQPEN